MERSEYKIHIIGAGISGLIAAQVLESHGYSPVIYESTNRVGGRIKTDLLNGYQLDHGFQVLLEAYPKAKQYLDFDALELQALSPGAVLFTKGKSKTIGDPLRDPTLLFSTLFSGIGTWKDKLKIFQLNRNLKQKSLQNIFASEEVTTLNYLKGKGFSEEIISKFFKPFFSGIFLEPHLETSSRMFEFVYKMFGEGLAVIPKKGMGEISRQLAEKLKKTTILFETTVEKVEEGSLTLMNGDKTTSHFTIIATDASSLVSNLKGQEIKWKSCHNIYFEVNDQRITKPMIGLVTDSEALINNIFFHNTINTQSRGEKELLSVTIVKATQLSDTALVNRVEKELSTYCGIKDLKFLKHYKIKKALPDLSSLQYEIAPTETQLSTGIFLAGDHLLNGSQNAAIMAGERAALGVIQTLEGGTITGDLTSEYM